MNKTNKGIEVNLSVVAVSAILVAALFVMSSSRFMPDAMAQNATSQTGAAVGGAANQTGAAVGGAANQTGAAVGGAANQTGMMMNETGGAANQTGGGGAANQTGGGGAANQTAMVMIPQSSMMTMMDNVQTAMSAVGDDEEAMMALQSVDQELRSAATAAGMSVPTTSDTGGDTDTDDGGDTSDDGGDTDTDTDDGGDTSDKDTG